MITTFWTPVDFYYTQWGFPNVIGRADGPHLVNEKRGPILLQMHSARKILLKNAEGNIDGVNASPMMMSFFNDYSRFLSTMQTHIWLYICSTGI